MIWVIKKGKRWWDGTWEGKDKWTSSIRVAAHLRTLHLARVVARRTDGEVYQLVPVPLRSTDR